MLIELPHKIKTIGIAILTTSGLLLGFVWTYLEKVLPIKTSQELPTLYLVQIATSGIIILFALLALVILLVFHLWGHPKRITPIDLSNSKFWPDLGVSQDLKTHNYICPKCSHFLRIDKDGLCCGKCNNFIPVNMSEALLKHIQILNRFTNAI
jgi:hypothetical protein